MITLAEKQDCVGCSACVDKCAFGAISIQRDGLGFIYPEINHSLCKECNRCVRSCPILNKPEHKKTPIKAYLMQSKNSAVLSDSASGGFCTEAYLQVLGNGTDTIVGAIYDESFNVVHAECSSLEEIKKLSGSKYVQSTATGIYVKTEQLLKQGKSVIFSGTPCQVAGLRSYLGKNYTNLVTMDFLCHSVPSPRAWNVYLKNKEKKLGKVIGVRFKSKKYGYSFPTLELKTQKNGCERTYNYTSQSDGFMSAFLQGRISRQSCQNCIFRDSHCSDITVADYYRFSEITSDFKNDSGISRVCAWTNTGETLIDSLKEHFIWKEIETVKIFFPDDFGNVKVADKYEINDLTDKEIMRHCLRVRFKDRLISSVRVVLQKVGLQKFVKKLIKG